MKLGRCRIAATAAARAPAAPITTPPPAPPAQRDSAARGAMSSLPLPVPHGTSLLYPSLNSASWFSGLQADENAHVTAWETFHEQQVARAPTHAHASLAARARADLLTCHAAARDPRLERRCAHHGEGGAREHSRAKRRRPRHRRGRPRRGAPRGPLCGTKRLGTMRSLCRAQDDGEDEELDDEDLGDETEEDDFDDEEATDGDEADY